MLHTNRYTCPDQESDINTKATKTSTQTQLTFANKNILPFTIAMNLGMFK